MQKVRLFFIIVLSLLIFQNIQAQGASCIDGLPCKERNANILPGTVSHLTQDSKLDYDNFLSSGDVVIQTNGFNLTLQVQKKLAVGTFLIRAFDKSAESNLGQEEKGKESFVSYNSGPNTDGPVPCDACPLITASQCFACPGRPGGTGGPGVAGKPGTPGKAAGQAILRLGGKGSFQSSGTIIFDLRGQSGGMGGKGGDGGNGGNGEQGGKGFEGQGGGCAQEAQRGGRGGDGGDAGRGGKGGRAGDGGSVTVVKSAEVQLIIKKSDVSPGIPGAGGEPGAPGRPGNPGMGGRGSNQCPPTDRQGENGNLGRPSDQATTDRMRGLRGEEGRAGSFILIE